MCLTQTWNICDLLHKHQLKFNICYCSLIALIRFLLSSFIWRTVLSSSLSIQMWLMFTIQSCCRNLSPKLQFAVHHVAQRHFDTWKSSSFKLQTLWSVTEQLRLNNWAAELQTLMFMSFVIQNKQSLFLRSTLRFYSTFYLLLSQTFLLPTLRDSLWRRGLSSEVQPLPSDRAGHELQQAAGFRSGAAVCWTEESKLQTGDSEVTSCVLFSVDLSNLIHNSVLNFLQFFCFLGSLSDQKSKQLFFKVSVNSLILNSVCY